MIYTLTLNPSIDYIMPLEHLQHGATNYAQGEYMLPGGKGINVSRVLNRLDVPNQAIGFIGGHTGKFIEEWLDKEGADYHFIPVEGQTRINVKLKGKSETEINGRGPVISEEESQKLMEQIDQLTSQDILVISGSKNTGLSETFYNEVIKICQIQSNRIRRFIWPNHSKQRRSDCLREKITRSWSSKCDCFFRRRGRDFY